MDLFARPLRRPSPAEEDSGEKAGLGSAALEAPVGSGGGGFGQAYGRRRWQRAETLTQLFYGARPALLHRDLEKYALSEEELDRHGYPRPTAQPGRVAFQRLPLVSSEPRLVFRAEQDRGRLCCRCTAPFFIGPRARKGGAHGEPLCHYHHGHLVLSTPPAQGPAQPHKAQLSPKGKSPLSRLAAVESAPQKLCGGPAEGKGKEKEKTWDCCGAAEGSKGCSSAPRHVTDALREADRRGYVRTQPLGHDRKAHAGVFALDCEMVYTEQGLELGRVTLVDLVGRLVYDRLVLPSSPIVDFNTRFSGLLPRHFATVRTTLGEVQAELRALVAAETLLIGHSLQTDLRALRLCHSAVVDTALVFPHRKGAFYKRSLRSLAQDVLGRRIQTAGGRGHSSLEDANTAFLLMLSRLRDDASLPLFRV